MLNIIVISQQYFYLPEQLYYQGYFKSNEPKLKRPPERNGAKGRNVSQEQYFLIRRSSMPCSRSETKLNVSGNWRQASLVIQALRIIQLVTTCISHISQFSLDELGWEIPRIRGRFNFPIKFLTFSNTVPIIPNVPSTTSGAKQEFAEKLLPTHFLTRTVFSSTALWMFDELYFRRGWRRGKVEFTRWGAHGRSHNGGAETGFQVIGFEIQLNLDSTKMAMQSLILSTVKMAGAEIFWPCARLMLHSGH